MTETEWLTCKVAHLMLETLRDNVSERKLRLFAVASCVRVWNLFPDERSRNAIQIAELFADDRATGDNLREARAAAEEAQRAVPRPQRSGYCYWGNTSAEAALACVATEAIPPADRPAPQHNYFTTAAGAAANAKAAHHLWSIEEAEPLDLIPDDGSYDNARDQREEEFQTLWDEIRRVEWAAQAELLREIFGNVFRSVAFSPEWRTDTAVSLGQQMYEARDFGALPILADALQDAGCDNDDILSHCRDSSITHVRGCWVVDLVLRRR
jgi:hypothetical protein